MWTAGPWAAKLQLSCQGPAPEHGRRPGFQALCCAPCTSARAQGYTRYKGGLRAVGMAITPGLLEPAPTWWPGLTEPVELAWFDPHRLRLASPSSSEEPET